MSETEREYGKLNVAVRHDTGKGVARKLRADGRIPAVIYGKGQGNVLLSLDPNELRKALDPERKLNTFFQLELVDGDSTSTEQCVITDYQLDKVKDRFLHIDFLRVDPNTPVTVQIPAIYFGRPAGVVAGGKLRTFRRTVRIAAKPAEIPTKLEVELTEIGLGEQRRLKELSIPNAEILDHPETVMALVEAPRGKKEDKKDS